MATANDGVQYTVTFINQSTNDGNFCLYQTDPDLGVDNVFSLAWFSKYVGTGTGQQAKFTWSIDYCFVWAETGALQPGVIFDASQIVPADLSTTNQITLNYTRGYSFISQEAGPANGSLYITEDTTVPLKVASVGVGMSGSGTFVTSAQPNDDLIFTPHPSYWCVFGEFEPGQVMNVEIIHGHSAEISFDPGVYAMFAILQKNNTWIIQSTSDVNKRLLAAQKTNPDITLEELDFSTPLKELA